MPDDPRNGGFDLGSLLPVIGAIGALRGNVGMAQGFQQAQQLRQQQQEAQQLADYRQGQLGLQEQGLGLQQQRIDLDRNNQAMQFIESGRQMLGSITNTDQLREAHALLRATSQQFGVDPEIWNQPVSQRSLAIPFERKRGKYEEIVERFDPQQIQGMRESGAMVTVDGELVRFDQLERDVLGLGPGFEVPAVSQDDNVSLQSKEMLLDGRPVPLNFNPRTGVFTVPGTETPIDPSRIGLIPEPVPTFMAQTFDEAGNPVTSVVPRTPGTAVPREASRGSEPSSTQFQAATFANRLEQAESTLSTLEEGIASFNSAAFAAFERLPNVAKPPEVRQYEQAARNFINAQLRRESGAAIAESEFADARAQYLPRPGDDPETLAQKRRNRELVFNGLRREAAGAYQPLPEISDEPNTNSAPTGQNPWRR